MNGWKLLLSGAIVGVLSWALLYFLYRIDRPDTGAIVGASMTVLLIVPPLVSYALAMEFSRLRPLYQQVLCVYALALLWIPVQREIIYPTFGLRPELGENVANFLLLPAFGIATWLGIHSFRYRRRLQHALALQEQSEIRLLEAQLAPHLLFNMLNTVYSALLTDREQSVPLFLSMSEMLRHVVDRTRKAWIPAHEELAFIEHYAALERARNERTRIHINVDGDTNAPVPPMLLATLFENAVKHGRLPDGTLEIGVDVVVDDTSLRFTIRNRHAGERNGTRGMGVGQGNVRRRLELLYPGRHQFVCNDMTGIYTAQVAIQL